MDPNNTDELQALLEPLSKVQMLSILLACARNNIETKEFITSTAKQRRCHRRLYIRNLSYETTDEALAKAFSKYGIIEEASIVRKDGRSKGFGFVTFQDFWSAQNACDAELSLDGRIISVKMASGTTSVSTVTSPGQSEEILKGCPRKVFVRNLSYNATSEDLRKAVEDCGDIIECVVITSMTGENRGFGFVTFKESAGAVACLSDPQRVVCGRLAFFHTAVQSNGPSTSSVPIVDSGSLIGEGNLSSLEGGIISNSSQVFFNLDDQIYNQEGMEQNKIFRAMSSASSKEFSAPLQQAEDLSKNSNNCFVNNNLNNSNFPTINENNQNSNVAAHSRAQKTRANKYNISHEQPLSPSNLHLQQSSIQNNMVSEPSSVGSYNNRNKLSRSAGNTTNTNLMNQFHYSNQNVQLSERIRNCMNSNNTRQINSLQINNKNNNNIHQNFHSKLNKQTFEISENHNKQKKNENRFSTDSDRAIAAAISKTNRANDDSNDNLDVNMFFKQEENLEDASSLKLSNNRNLKEDLRENTDAESTSQQSFSPLMLVMNDNHQINSYENNMNNNMLVMQSLSDSFQSPFLPSSHHQSPSYNVNNSLMMNGFQNFPNQDYNTTNNNSNNMNHAAAHSQKQFAHPPYLQSEQDAHNNNNPHNRMTVDGCISSLLISLQQDSSINQFSQVDTSRMPPPPPPPPPHSGYPPQVRGSVANISQHHHYINTHAHDSYLSPSILHSSPNPRSSSFTYNHPNSNNSSHHVAATSTPNTGNVNKPNKGYSLPPPHEVLLSTPITSASNNANFNNMSSSHNATLTSSSWCPSTSSPPLSSAANIHNNNINSNGIVTAGVSSGNTPNPTMGLFSLTSSSFPPAGGALSSGTPGSSTSYPLQHHHHHQHANHSVNNSNSTSATLNSNNNNNNNNQNSNISPGGGHPRSIKSQWSVTSSS